MSSIIGCLGLLALFIHSSLAQNNTCISFGIDFQDGQTYFQNSLSSDNFTFVQEFEGCEQDNAQNILVKPNGDQLQCTDTPMTPADTPEMSTCPIEKSQLVAGDWTVIIISNNGDAAPIAYQRDFILSVGPQVTQTVTPIVTVNVTSTPVFNNTKTVVDTTSFTLPPVTTTAPSLTITPTQTITPDVVTTTETHILYTVHRTIPEITVSKIIKTVTATCTVPPRQETPDKLAVIRPTIVSAAAFENRAPPSPTANAKDMEARRRARSFKPRDLEDVPSFLAKRRAYLAERGEIVKRAPDLPTVTVTDTNTAVWPTTTSTVMMPTKTVDLTSTNMVTATVTPSPVTVIEGQSTAALIVVTLPTSTRTVDRYTVAWDIQTKLYTYTQVITTTVSPTASASACRGWGGWLVPPPVWQPWWEGWN